jgi:carnitine 3-dehydrogenase
MSNPRQIRRVAIVGVGVIGASWATYFLAQGLDVSATDPMPGAEEKMRDAVKTHWPSMERLGLAPGASMDRLAFSADLATALRDAGFCPGKWPRERGLENRFVSQNGCCFAA